MRDVTDDVTLRLAAAIKSDYPQMPESQLAHICLTLLEPFLRDALAATKPPQDTRDDLGLGGTDYGNK